MIPNTALTLELPILARMARPNLNRYTSPSVFLAVTNTWRPRKLALIDLDLKFFLDTAISLA
jgi:hypothetical protein